MVGGGVYWYQHRDRTVSFKAGVPETESVSENDPRFLARVERRTLVHSVETSGDIQPFSQVDVKPEVSGRIKKIYVIAGQKVKSGDPLVELDDHDLLTEKIWSRRSILITPRPKTRLPRIVLIAPKAVCNRWWIDWPRPGLTAHSVEPFSRCPSSKDRL